MVQKKKGTASKSKRKLTVRKESLKDLSVKEVQKVKGGAIDPTLYQSCFCRIK